MGSKNTREQTGLDLRATIYDLYWNKRLSQALIARKLGVCQQLISRRMQEMDLPIRTRGQAHIVAIEEGRLNPSETIRRSNATVALQVAKGTRKWNRPGAHGRSIRLLEERCGVSFKTILEYMYWDQEMGSQEIADCLTAIFNSFPGRRVNLTRTFICQRMKKYGIPRRSGAEAYNLVRSRETPKSLTPRQLAEGLSPVVNRGLGSCLLAWQGKEEADDRFSGNAAVPLLIPGRGHNI